MNLKLKRIAPLPAGKMLAALDGLLALVFVPFLLAFMAVGSLAARTQGGAGAPALPLMFGMGVGFIIMPPLMYAVISFLGGVIGAWVYNLLAGWLGGFELDFETQAAPPVAPMS